MARMIPENLWLETMAREAGYHPGELARRLGWSEWQLRRSFRRWFKCSPRVWLTALRMKDVEAALASGEQVKNLASIAGFEQSCNFFRWFKANKHMTVGEVTALLFSPKFPSSRSLSSSSSAQRRPEM